MWFCQVSSIFTVLKKEKNMEEVGKSASQLEAEMVFLLLGQFFLMILTKNVELLVENSRSGSLQ